MVGRRAAVFEVQTLGQKSDMVLYFSRGKQRTLHVEEFVMGQKVCCAKENSQMPLGACNP